MTLEMAIYGFIGCLIMAIIGVYIDKVNNVPSGKVLQWVALAVAIIIGLTLLFTMV
jgi:hypothetical protein